jgi:hypothetical protein
MNNNNSMKIAGIDMLELVSDLDTMSTEWLTQALQQSGLLQHASVSAFQWTIIGTGKMGDNARLQLQYDGEAGDAPSSLVAKLPAKDDTARGMAAAMGAYQKEVLFYQQLAKETSVRIPQVYVSLIDEQGADFIILMEDLAPAEPGDQFVSESFARSQAVLSEAAQLHADFYQHKNLLDHPAITQTDADSAAFGQSLLEQQWEGFKQRFGHGLNAECLAFGDRYITAHVAWTQTYQGPKTLIHGDLRTENILYSPGNAATLVDWQTAMASCGLADVAYFLGGSLDTEARRQHEQNLLEGYRVKLNALGVELSAADCWQQYRQFSIHALMITILGAMFSEPDERADAMFLIMAQRHLQHCVDMQAEAFLPEIGTGDL